jgi:hypothetical protein
MVRDRVDKNQNEASRGKADFSVWRLDDNNNEFLVRDKLTEQEALALVREYEGKGHRQAYWVKWGSEVGGWFIAE